jgi:hypothetical protein
MVGFTRYTAYFVFLNSNVFLGILFSETLVHILSNGEAADSGKD